MVRRSRPRHALQKRGKARDAGGHQTLRGGILDEAAAEKTALQGLAASGWHTAAIAMRLATDVRPFGSHPLLGIGVDELRWLAPVRPGDVLHIEGEVVELAPSKTKPQGVVKVKWTAFNQHSEPVYTFTPIGIVPRRPG